MANEGIAALVCPCKGWTLATWERVTLATWARAALLVQPLPLLARVYGQSPAVVKYRPQAQEKEEKIGKIGKKTFIKFKILLKIISINANCPPAETHKTASVHVNDFQPKLSGWTELVPV